jgi:hypothetical protein
VIGIPDDGWFHFLATPTPPLLLAPDSGSFTADNTPVFDWTDVPDMSLYRLQVDDDNTFSSPEIDDATLSSSTHTPGAPLADTLYYWHVSSGNGFAWSDWSATWIFTIDSHVPNIPLLISPSDSSILSDDTPTFTWSKVAKVVLSEPDIEHKTPTDAVAEKATEITYNLKITLDGDSTVYQTSDTTFTLVTSLQDSTFVWQVQAEDEAANRSGYSPPYVLIIDTEPPEISNTTVWQDTSLMGPFAVYSTITDGRGVAGAELWYRTSVDTNWTYLSMDSTGLPTDNYMAEIPLQTENNTTISYYVHAEDVAVTPNESTDPESGADSSYSFVAGVTGIAEDPLGTPEILFISQNYPNPFTGATQIRFGLPANSWVDISIYSLSGQNVATLVNEEKAAGYSTVVWDGRDDCGRTVSSGVYFLRFSARPVHGASFSTEGEEYVITRKLSVMR